MPRLPLGRVRHAVAMSTPEQVSNSVQNGHSPTAPGSTATVIGSRLHAQTGTPYRSDEAVVLAAWRTGDTNRPRLPAFDAGLFLGFAKDHQAYHQDPRNHDNRN